MAGWIHTYLFAFVTITSLYISMWFQHNLLAIEILTTATALPLVTLGAVAPLAAARSFWGWSLTRGEQVEIPRPEHRVEDLFFFSIITACSIAAANLFAPPGTNPMEAIIGTVVCSAFSLMLIVPVAAITFRSSSWWQRGLGYLCFTLAIVGISCLIIWLLVPYPSSLLIEVLFWVPLFALSWIVGNVALVASGFRLTRYAPRTEVVRAEVANPLDVLDDDISTPSTEEKLARRQARWVTTGVAVVTMLLVIGTFFRDQGRVALYREFANPADYFGAAVAKIDMDNDQIAGVVMSPAATDKDIQQVAKRAPQIKKLSLASTKFADESIDLLKAFSKLEQLDLSGTSITNTGLSKLPAIRTLSLADTKVSFLEAMRFARSKRLGTLDLSGIGMTDDDIKAASDIAMMMTALKLARNPISDEGVAALLTHEVQAMELDLSDTQVDGSCLVGPFCPQKVNLDGTQVTDAVLGKLLKMPVWKCQSVSLRRTQVTAAVLPALDRRTVRLGHGKSLKPTC